MKKGETVGVDISEEEELMNAATVRRQGDEHSFLTASASAFYRSTGAKSSASRRNLATSYESTVSVKAKRLADSALYSPLQYYLETICCNLECYGESYQETERGTLALKSSFFPPTNENTTTQPIYDFSLFEADEECVEGVGLPGLSLTLNTHFHIYHLEDLVNNPEFATGVRLPMAARLFKEALVLPLYSGRARYIGTIVLYFFDRIRHITAVCTYMSAVYDSVAANVTLFSHRNQYMNKTMNRVRSNMRIMKIALRFFMPMLVRYYKNNNNARPLYEEVDSSIASSGRIASDMFKTVYRNANVEFLSSVSSSRAPSQPMPDVFPDMEPTNLSSSKYTKLLAVARAYFLKWRGDQVTYIARLSWLEAGNTWAGVFFSFLFLGLFYKELNRHASFQGVSNNLFLIPAPFGALSMLLFSVPASPLTQPRIVILSHALAIVIAVVVLFIFRGTHDEYLWLQLALGLATSVSAMGLLGITHPPAGAICGFILLFGADARYTDGRLLFLIISIWFACLLFIFMAVVTNNLLEKRRYPLYW